MRSFKVTDGDLFVGANTNHGRVSMVTGRDKLIQDLTLWLLEPLGTGFTTPGFGSTLTTYSSRDERHRGQGTFVGRPYDDRTTAELEAEVDRVLNLYQQAQITRIRQAQLEGRLFLYTRAEILNAIDSVDSTTDRDRAIIRAFITTGANQEIDFMAQINTDETDIAAV